MSYKYITTFKPDTGQEHTVPKLLQTFLKTNYNMVVPEDFGPQGSIPFPVSDEYILLFSSKDEPDFGHLIVFEGTKHTGWRTEFIVYGGLEAECPQCHQDFDKDSRFCPNCGSRLQCHL